MTSRTGTKPSLKCRRGCGDGGVVVTVTAVLGVYAVRLRDTLAGGHPYRSPTPHLLAISGNISYGIHLFRDQLTLVKLYRPWSCQLHRYSTHTSCSTASSPQAATQPTRTWLFSCGKPNYRTRGSCDDEAMRLPIIYHLKAASSWNTVTEHPTLENWWINFLLFRSSQHKNGASNCLQLSTCLTTQPNKMICPHLSNDITQQKTLSLFVLQYACNRRSTWQDWHTDLS